MATIKRLFKNSNGLLFGLSWLIVAFGQPAWSSLLGLFAGCIGYALFWKVLLDIESPKKRFYIGMAWFTAVQFIQLSWGLSHPFYYIIAPFVIYASLMGMQFGILCLFITRPLKFLPLCSLWVLMEWSRLFFFSGFAFNPVGLALAAHVSSLQMASLAGIYGMSFWVFLTNFLFLKLWINKRINTFLPWIAVACLPYAYGSIQLAFEKNDTEEPFKALLVQTAFPVEEDIHFSSHQALKDHVFNEWKQIVAITKPYFGHNIDLLALPEFVVPFGTYSFIFPYEKVKEVFVENFGPDALESLPPLELPLAVEHEGEWLVNNAFWAQSLSNLFQTNLASGMEDAQDVLGKREYYSAALFFKPSTGTFQVKRYAKRVLVPMGEYIPFSFFRDMAANYGVMGSFTPGDHAEVWECCGSFLGVSICYEEMFGNLMRENRNQGATILLNLTSDAWFPHSKLIRQHFEHARVRTVENGIPLIRACNTGITGGIDSYGRDIALFGDNDREREDLAGALFVQVPKNNYFTLYSWFGDRLILLISLSFILSWAIMSSFGKISHFRK